MIFANCVFSARIDVIVPNAGQSISMPSSPIEAPLVLHLSGQHLDSSIFVLQGDQPHCGFPESNYHLHAERLARAGLRVVVVEQTETPDQLKIRNEERRAAGKPKASP